MPKQSRVFSVNLGMQTVSLAELVVLPNGGLALSGWQTEELMVDPAADATRSAQLESALLELRNRMKVPQRALASVVLPSQSVFNRFVRLPGASANDVEDIIGFEAQQNVPFPIDEVVWDHQIMGEQRDGTWDVVLVAIKADQLTEVVSSITKAGLRPALIDAAPVALYNAFRFNYSDVGGSSLLLDIGARTTNVIFIEENRLFSRTIPVGGSTLSNAIAKEFKQDITLAERLKIEKGFVGLGGAYAEPDDPMVGKISKVIRNALTRLHAEVARSVSFYRQSQGGSPPVRAYLAGGTVQLPYMLEFFTEKLQIPVEYFNALRNVSVTSPELSETLSSRAHCLGELVGAALRQAGSSPIEINLRPVTLIREQELEKRKPLLIMASICALASVGAWQAFHLKASEITEVKLAQVNSEVQKLQNFANQIEAVVKEQKALESEAAPLVAGARQRSAWLALLDELGRRLPNRFIWVTGITPLTGGKPAKVLSDGTQSATTTAPLEPTIPGRTDEASQQQNAIDALEISGLYLANPPNEKEQRIIDEFVNNLQQSPVFKIEADAKVVTQRTTPDGTRWAYGYTLVLPLAEPIPLN